jgi:hypothetical protein
MLHAVNCNVFVVKVRDWTFHPNSRHDGATKPVSCHTQPEPSAQPKDVPEQSEQAKEHAIEAAKQHEVKLRDWLWEGVFMHVCSGLASRILH